ncbi:MAG: HEAT repeat domain-containing protein [Candidatus Hodarchaeota archaeon]
MSVLSAIAKIFMGLSLLSLILSVSPPTSPVNTIAYAWITLGLCSVASILAAAGYKMVESSIALLGAGSSIMIISAAYIIYGLNMLEMGRSIIIPLIIPWFAYILGVLFFLFHDLMIEEGAYTKMPNKKVRKLKHKEMNIFFRDLNNPAGRTQINAIIRLGNMGDETAIPHLEKLLKKDSYSIKKLTETAINKIKGRYTIIKVCAYLELDTRIRNRAVYFYHTIMKDRKSESKITNNILLVAFCLIMTVRENKDLAPVTVQDIIKGFKQLGHEVSIKDIFELSLKIMPKYKEMFNKNI